MARLTTAIELTATAEKVKSPVVLSKEFSKFAEVFSKEATNHVLLRMSFDYTNSLGFA